MHALITVSYYIKYADVRMYWRYKLILGARYDSVRFGESSELVIDRNKVSFVSSFHNFHFPRRSVLIIVFQHFWWSIRVL
jgi:hypothetical protein